MIEPGQTIEHFAFPDLSASAELVRIKAEGQQHRRDQSVIGRAKGGFPIYGPLVHVEYGFDVNSLTMTRFNGLLDTFKQGQSMIEDTTHLSEVPEDDAARLVAVREEVEAMIRFSRAFPDWKGVTQESV